MTKLIKRTNFIEEEQEALFDQISNERVTKSEHKRRAYDMYLSQPAIQEAILSSPTKHIRSKLRSSAMLADNASGAVGGIAANPEGN